MKLKDINLQKLNLMKTLKTGIFFYLILLIVITPAFSQNTLQLSGVLTDKATGEALYGATVYIDQTKSGCVANSYGFYSLTLPAGNYTIKYSFIGYEDLIKEINLSVNQKVNVELSEKSEEIQEVIVMAEAADRNISSVEMSTVNLDMKQMKSIPVIFGEQDILKTIQLKPGVSSAGEGNSGFNVRGGSPDQNLILLDEAPVYNASHLLGFFSVFNADAIRSVELYKGAIPAQYGGRVSSVLDVKMNEGNSKQLTASGGIGLIASRLTIESPIIKDKSSFIISGRRTYADVFMKLSPDEKQQNTSLYFYDLNMKANYKINDRNRIFLSGYFYE